VVDGRGKKTPRANGKLSFHRHEQADGFAVQQDYNRFRVALHPEAKPRTGQDAAKIINVSPIEHNPTQRDVVLATERELREDELLGKVRCQIAFDELCGLLGQSMIGQDRRFCQRGIKYETAV